MAARLDKAELETLKSQNPILEVARDLGLEAVRQRLRCFHAERHAHGDRTPSVTLSPERGTFKCWVCPDVKGDVIDLVRLAKGTGFAEAVEFLRSRSGFKAQTQAPYHAHGAHPTSPSQTDLFPEAHPPAPKNPAGGTWDPGAEARRQDILEYFLSLCGPVRGKPSSWLRKRRIFQKTWTAQKLRAVDDYGTVSEALAARFPMAALRESGLFNAEGHLRFYRHPLVLPYFDLNGRVVYLQARALDPEIKPKELSLAGPIPCPYNAVILDGSPGHLYLCEGVIDTLTLLEAGFAAAGVPGAANFKAAWIPLFRSKSVFVAFDADAPGEAGAAKTMALLSAGGIETHRLAIPAGKDINEWLRGGR